MTSAARRSPPGASRVRWFRPAVAVVAWSVALRAVASATVGLMPEEAYYWNYGRHLDFGYLDHPPLIGWFIRAAEAVAGPATRAGAAGADHAAVSRWIVRLPAMACWAVTAWFAALHARTVLGRRAAWPVAALVAVLPYFFVSGTVATPDAPLMASWSAAVYFLGRALVGGRRLAWWGAGVALGVGMLSKYTAALLIPATAAAMLTVPAWRVWFRRPEPWAALLLALAMFSPVIVWNAGNQWVSFAFQTSGRRDPAAGFGLHWMPLHVAALLTPWALVVAAVFVAGRFGGGRFGGIESIRRVRRSGPIRSGPRRHRAGRIARGRTLALCLTGVPLATFAVHALADDPKMHWSGPAWLAALPYAMVALRAGRRGTPPQGLGSMARWWNRTAVGLVALFTAAVIYASGGAPRAWYPGFWLMPMPWPDLAAAVEKVAARVTAETGRRPLLVGMDTNALASALAFHAPRGGGDRTVAGAGLFLRKDLMYSRWHPPRAQASRDLVLVSWDARTLERWPVPFSAARLHPVETLTINWRGAPFYKVHVRVLHGYRPVARRTEAVRNPGE